MSVFYLQVLKILLQEMSASWKAVTVFLWIVHQLVPSSVDGLELVLKAV